MANPDEMGLEVAKAAAEGAGRESINKVSEFFRTIFPFWGMEKAAVDTYVAEVQNSNLAPALKMMAIANTKQTFKHLKNQQRIAEIAESVAPEETDFSSDSGVDEMWLERFMDSAKFVSDEKVQALWGSVLAKEFENPNSTPPSVIRILTEITPYYAKIFQILCSLRINVFGDNDSGKLSYLGKLLILPKDYDYLSQYNIHFGTLNETSVLGLIQFDSVNQYIRKYKLSEYPRLHIMYGGKIASITSYPDEALPTGIAIFSDAGNALSRFTESTIVEQHFDSVIQYLKNKKVVFADVPMYRITQEGTIFHISPNT